MAENETPPAELSFLEKNPFVAQVLGYVILCGLIAVGVYLGIKWAHRSI
jgi:hypothetical protein